MNPYQKFIEGRDPLEVLATTPRRLRELVSGLTPAQLQERPAPGKWSIHETVAHLADTELIFSQRCRSILFDDNKFLPAMNQNNWSHGWQREQEPFDETLERFRVMRGAQVRLFRAASGQDLKRTGTHEENGVESAADYLLKLAGHDVNHLEQIERLRAATAGSSRVAAGGAARDGFGALEEQMDMRDTIPQRADRTGRTVEDMAGTGKADAPGG